MSTTDKLTKNIEKVTENIKERATSVADVANTVITNPKKLVDKLKENALFKNKLNIVLLILALSLLIFAAYVVYVRFVKPRLTPKYVSNNEFTNTGKNTKNSATLKLYHAAEWCSFSRDVLNPKNGTWILLKNELDNTVINGKKIMFEEIDCSNVGDSDKGYDGSLDEETKDIDGYPTIKLIIGSESIIYNNDISQSNDKAIIQLKEFINSNI
jgi:hypothetical protein